jgi:hypothetical protein
MSAHALLKDFRPASERPDKGVLYETAVMLHLVSQLRLNRELRFWRTKKGEEVDFIFLENRIPIPIEVKSKLMKPEIPSGINAFLKRYPDAPAAVVFNDSIESTLETGEGKKVYFKKWYQASDWESIKSVL